MTRIWAVKSLGIDPATGKEVFEKLAGALAEYKSKLNEKKFENNLKKASKLFAVDIVKAIKKDRKTRRAMEVSNKKTIKVI